MLLLRYLTISDCDHGNVGVGNATMAPFDILQLPDELLDDQTVAMQWVMLHSRHVQVYFE